MADVQVVFATDQNFFLLAKGLVLSIHRTGSMPKGFDLAVIDIGCTPDQLQWFREANVRVIAFDERMLGALARMAPGYLHALVLRPFLPEIFPDARAILWLDSDIWIQNPQTLHLFGSMALAHPEKIFICPEWHYCYTGLNDAFIKNQIQYLGALYTLLYDQATVELMAGRPQLNCGVFAMSGASPLWAMWKAELPRLYSRQYGERDAMIRHVAEQAALNVLAVRHNLAVAVDPVFNYLCFFGAPVRDEAGIVRVPLPPNTPVGVVHLVQWSYKRKHYLERGLLFDSGKYLTDAEKQQLLQ